MNKKLSAVVKFRAKIQLFVRGCLTILEKNSITEQNKK